MQVTNFNKNITVSLIVFFQDCLETKQLLKTKHSDENHLKDDISILKKNITQIPLLHSIISKLPRNIFLGSLLIIKSNISAPFIGPKSPTCSWTHRFTEGPYTKVQAFLMPPSFDQVMVLFFSLLVKSKLSLSPEVFQYCLQCLLQTVMATMGKNVYSIQHFHQKKRKQCAAKA